MKAKMSRTDVGSRYKIFRTANKDCYLFDMDHSLKNVFFPLFYRYRWHPAHKISEQDAEDLETASASASLTKYIYLILAMIVLIDLFYLFFNYDEFDFQSGTITSLFIYFTGAVFVLWLRVKMIRRPRPVIKNITGKDSTEPSQIKIRAGFGRELHMVFVLITAYIVLITISLLPLFFQDIFLLILFSPLVIFAATFLNQLYAEKTVFNLLEK